MQHNPFELLFFQRRGAYKIEQRFQIIAVIAFFFLFRCIFRNVQRLSPVEIGGRLNKISAPHVVTEYGIVDEFVFRIIKCGKVEHGHDADIEQRVEKRKLAAGKQPNARRIDVPVRIFVVAKGETSVFKSDRIRFASAEHVGCDDERRTRRQIDRIRLRLHDAPVVEHAFERRRVEHE